MNNYHFLKCANNVCDVYFPINISELHTNNLKLCLHCSQLQKQSHIVQCIYCGTVIGIIPKNENELPDIIYVKKCKNCGGTLVDEISFVNKIQD